MLGGSHLHGVDSTELANYCKIPLASIEINGKKIRIYNDIDCDCGARRNKRDKSRYVVGEDKRDDVILTETAEIFADSGFKSSNADFLTSIGKIRYVGCFNI